MKVTITIIAKDKDEYKPVLSENFDTFLLDEDFEEFVDLTVRLSRLTKRQHMITDGIRAIRVTEDGDQHIVKI